MGVRSVPKILTCGLAIACLAVVARGVIPDDSMGQYQTIHERNVFGLRPPPAQAQPTNPPAPLPKIILTGITTILDNKRALMKVLPVGLKPGDVVKEVSLILTEGQREGDVEVLQIDENAGSVKVKNSGTVMTLTFEKDGAKLPASAPVPGVPTAPPLPGALPVAGVSLNPYLQATNVRKFPTRATRTPGGLPGTAGVNGGAAAPGGIPTPTGFSSSPAQTPTLADQEMTAEEQAIVLELQRQANANNPTFPPLPPTPTAPTGAQPAQPGVPVVGANAQSVGNPAVLVPQ